VLEKPPKRKRARTRFSSSRRDTSIQPRPRRLSAWGWSEPGSKNGDDVTLEGQEKGLIYPLTVGSLVRHFVLIARGFSREEREHGKEWGHSKRRKNEEDAWRRN